MAVISKGQTFATGDQVTALKLNNLADNATFASGAVDNASTQLSNGSIIVKDEGVTTAKLADVNVTTGKLADSSVTTAKIADDSVTFDKLNGVLDEDDLTSDSATAVATQQSIKAYVDASDTDGYAPTAYDGEESVTFPNGLIMKFGRIAATSNQDHTITFGTAFPNAVISASAVPNISGSDNLSCAVKNTPSTTSMIVNIRGADSLTGIYWQAMGH